MSAWTKVAHCVSFHAATPAVAALVKSICDSADSGSAPTAANPLLAVFDGAESASGSIMRYMLRLTKYGGVAPSTFVTLFILLDRFAEAAPLHRRNAHRVVAAAFVVATMLSDDRAFAHGHYARVCEVPETEIRALFTAFIRVIDYRLDVPAQLYAKVECQLLAFAASMP
eukprot:TRINITY_DN1932_c0_g1_i3.p1 TRINITY_DN1932_c0_g1~~TRINITY_DN1932_c0_g1_i3.p1  ORF type:complete len:192 (+),score=45.08 TRINITY_DN1932_c0_g1_i3:67-576(+)